MKGLFSRAHPMKRGRGLENILKNSNVKVDLKICYTQHRRLQFLIGSIKMLENLKKGNFPKAPWATSQVTIFQVATSQRLGQALRGAAGCNGDECCGQDGLRDQVPRLEQAVGRALQLGHTWKLPLGILQIWEVATWENNLGKLQLGKNPLGKYLTS